MILEHIEKIASTSSRNEKEALLAEVLQWPKDQADFFTNCLIYAYTGDKDYYIKDVGFLDDSSFPFDVAKKGMFDILDELNARTVTGNKAKSLVKSFYMQAGASDTELFKRILTRDLRCGISAKTINKVFVGLVYEHPYMRCSTLNQKTLKGVKFPCYSQTKMDGMYVDVVVNDGKVQYISRQGKLLPLNLQGRDNYFLTYGSGFVFQGEVMVVDLMNGGYLPREVGNGYINSDEVKPMLCDLFFWDCITYDDFLKKTEKVPYSRRLERLFDFNSPSDGGQIHSTIKPITVKTCRNIIDIENAFKAERKLGNEGIVVKNMDMIWKDGTSKDQLKVKVVAECELRITGWNEGKGKYTGMVGSIICESEDGVIEVGVSGFSDAFRNKATKEIDKWIQSGKIMSVKYNDVIESDLKQGKKSLFLPRFSELREDKVEADTVEYITEQLERFELK